MARTEGSTGKHAAVIGGSIAGLLAARVLARHFEQVTLIERDTFPEGPTHRNGVPQARHNHVLLLKGKAIFERYFFFMVILIFSV
jgi:phytoene dehydrogenase-like protein